MVNYQLGLDATFSALADPTRRAILARLALGNTSVSELARPFEMSLPGVLKHIEVLERAGLVEAHKDGRVRRCRLSAESMKLAAEWLAHYEKFWQKRLDALESYLKESKEETSWQSRRLKPPFRSRSRARFRPRARESSRRGLKPKR